MGKSETKRRIANKLIARDGMVCHYCGKPLEWSTQNFQENGLSIDHMTPVKHGGEWDIDNLVLACRRCNLEKRTSDYHEFKMGKETDAILLMLMEADND